MGNLCPTTGSIESKAKERMRDLMHTRARQLEFDIKLQTKLKEEVDQRAMDIATQAQRAGRQPTDNELLEVRRLLYSSKVCERNIASYERSLFGAKALESTYLQAYDNMDEHELNRKIINEAKKLNINLSEFEQTIEQTRSLHEDLETVNDTLTDARAEAGNSLQMDATELDAQVAKLFKAAPNSNEWQFRGVAPISRATAIHEEPIELDDYKNNNNNNVHMVTTEEFGSRHNQSVFSERLGLLGTTTANKRSHVRPRTTGSQNEPLLSRNHARKPANHSNSNNNTYMNRLTDASTTDLGSDIDSADEEERSDRRQTLQLLLDP